MIRRRSGQTRQSWPGEDNPDTLFVPAYGRTLPRESKRMADSDTSGNRCRVVTEELALEATESTCFYDVSRH